jgi:hypothetical protein
METVYISDVSSVCSTKHGLIITGDRNGDLFIYKKNGDLYRKVRIAFKPITALCLCGKESTVLVGLETGVIYKYDMQVDEIQAKYESGQTAAVICLHVRPFSDFFASILYTRPFAITVWNSSKNTVCSFPMTVENGQLLPICSSDSTGTLFLCGSRVFIHGDLGAQPYQLPSESYDKNSKWRPMCVIPSLLAKIGRALVLIEFEIWEFPRILTIGVLPPTENILLTVSPNGGFVCVLCTDMLLMWDLCSCTVIWSLDSASFFPLKEQNLVARDLSFSVYGKYLCLCVSSSMYIFNFFSGTLVKTVSSTFSTGFKDISFNEKHNTVVARISEMDILQIIKNVM